jgi:hypothetical protein
MPSLFTQEIEEQGFHADAGSGNVILHIAAQPEEIAFEDFATLLDCSDSPWYPTMRFFRQKKEGAWEPVIHKAAAELARLASQR